MSAITLKARTESWPIAGTFTISRGSKTQATVIVAEAGDGLHTGRGEAVPYARYGETPEETLRAVEAITPLLAAGLSHKELQTAMPRGAARNAVDCALWDLESKRSGISAHKLAGIEMLKPLPVSYTISLDTAEAMAEAARKAFTAWPVLKLKLGKSGDPERLAAIRAAVPQARLIVDANEGWTAHNLRENLEACLKHRVEMVEQPLPAAEDGILSDIHPVIPFCADESVFDRASLAGLKGKYEIVNIKLDKTGGLTEALATAQEARRLGFNYMVGCMVSTSLSLAPAFLVAQNAIMADLDAAALLARDRDHGLRYEKGVLFPPGPALWG